MDIIPVLLEGMRVIMGFLMLFFVPGFALSLVIFPRFTDIGIIKRLAYSTVLSIGSVIVLVLFLYAVLRADITPENIIIGITAFSLIAFFGWLLEVWYLNRHTKGSRELQLAEDYQELQKYYSRKINAARDRFRKDTRTVVAWHEHLRSGLYHIDHSYLIDIGEEIDIQQVRENKLKVTESIIVKPPYPRTRYFELAIREYKEGGTSLVDDLQINPVLVTKKPDRIFLGFVLKRGPVDIAERIHKKTSTTDIQWIYGHDFHLFAIIHAEDTLDEMVNRIIGKLDEIAHSIKSGVPVSSYAEDRQILKDAFDAVIEKPLDRSGRPLEIERYHAVPFTAEPKEIPQPQVIQAEAKPVGIPKRPIIQTAADPTEIPKPQGIQTEAKPVGIPKRPVIQAGSPPKEISKRPVVQAGTGPKEIPQPQVVKTEAKPTGIPQRPVIQAGPEPQEIPQPPVIQTEAKTIGIPKRPVIQAGPEPQEIPQPPVIQTEAKTIGIPKPPGVLPGPEPKEISKRPFIQEVTGPKEIPQSHVIQTEAKTIGIPKPPGVQPGPEPKEVPQLPFVQVGTETIGILKHPVVFPRRPVVQPGPEPREIPRRPVIQVSAEPKEIPKHPKVPISIEATTIDRRKLQKEILHDLNLFGITPDSFGKSKGNIENIKIPKKMDINKQLADVEEEMKDLSWLYE